MMTQHSDDSLSSSFELGLREGLSSIVILTSRDRRSIVEVRLSFFDCSILMYLSSRRCEYSRFKRERHYGSRCKWYNDRSFLVQYKIFSSRFLLLLLLPSHHPCSSRDHATTIEQYFGPFLPPSELEETDANLIGERECPCNTGSTERRVGC